MRIAILEDDMHQAQLLQLWVESAGHAVQCFTDAAGFMQTVVPGGFDLLLFDWILPDMSGVEVLKWLREKIDKRIPVLFITKRDDEQDIVTALEMGADDYLVKPVKPPELLARIIALGRRTQLAESGEEVLHCDPYRIDPANHTINCDGRDIEMTPKEFELALFLFRNAGRLLSRSEILKYVWGLSPKLNTRTVDTHISRIRNKLNLDSENGWNLKAIYHHGYRLERVGTPSPQTDET